MVLMETSEACPDNMSLSRFEVAKKNLLPRKRITFSLDKVPFNGCSEKGGGHASNPLQLRIIYMFYGKHSMSPEVTYEVCLKPKQQNY